MRVGQGLRSLGGSSPGESECAGELREDILSDIEATISHSYESLNVDINQDIPSDIEETFSGVVAGLKRNGQALILNCEPRR